MRYRFLTIADIEYNLYKKNQSVCPPNLKNP